MMFLYRIFHFLVWNHLVGPDISAQGHRGRLSDVFCCLLVIHHEYHGVSL